MTTRAIIVMGVSGAGKTLIGQTLAQAIGWTFHDADDLHSPENVAKMAHGVGLTDDDRAPWLAALHALLAHGLETGERIVLACSALKQAYRDTLVPPEAPPGSIQFVYLDVPESVLRERLAQRVHHYATPALLPSQLEALEPPRDALRVDGTETPDQIVARIRAALRV